MQIVIFWSKLGVSGCRVTCVLRRCRHALYLVVVDVEFAGYGALAVSSIAPGSFGVLDACSFGQGGPSAAKSATTFGAGHTLTCGSHHAYMAV